MYNQSSNSNVKTDYKQSQASHSKQHLELNNSGVQHQMHSSDRRDSAAMQKTQVDSTSQDGLSQESRTSSVHHKKKVQPPQPRNREESTSRRSTNAAPGMKNQHNKSSETNNSNFD